MIVDSNGIVFVTVTFESRRI